MFSVPPLEVIIKIKSDKSIEEKVLNNSVILNEGSTVTFLCESHGGIEEFTSFLTIQFLYKIINHKFIEHSGKPLPIIHWYRNDEPIRKELTHNFVKDNTTVQSRLYVNSINSNDLNSVLKCQTSNDNLTFVSSSITFDINRE